VGKEIKQEQWDCDCDRNKDKDWDRDRELDYKQLQTERERERESELSRDANNKGQVATSRVRFYVARVDVETIKSLVFPQRESGSRDLRIFSETPSARRLSIRETKLFIGRVVAGKKRFCQTIRHGKAEPAGVAIGRSRVLFSVSRKQSPKTGEFRPSGSIDVKENRAVGALSYRSCFWSRRTSECLGHPKTRPTCSARIYSRDSALATRTAAGTRPGLKRPPMLAQHSDDVLERMQVLRESQVALVSRNTGRPAGE